MHFIPEWPQLAVNGPFAPALNTLNTIIVCRLEVWLHFWKHLKVIYIQYVYNDVVYSILVWSIVHFLPLFSKGYPRARDCTSTSVNISEPNWQSKMDAFEGIHSVRISSSPPPMTSSGRAYEVLKSGRSGIAVYSSAVFFGTPSEAEEKGCVVGR